MADKQLKDKAVKIKGKDYVLVADRVLYFNEQYPNGAIKTSQKLEGDTYLVMARVIPDVTCMDRQFTGHSQATIGDGMVNKTAALENAETSAVGRALAMMGIGVIESIASVDEIHKAENAKYSNFASVKQIKWMRDEAMRITRLEPGPDVDEWIEQVTGYKPNLVPSKAVMGVINQIRDKQEYTEVVHEVKDVVINDIPENISLEDLPY